MPSVLELYEKLKPKLGEQETRSLLEYVESTVEQRAATKADLERNTGELREEIRRREGELREEIRRVEGELREEIRRVEGALREEMHSMRADLFKEMHSMKADLIKWSFVFWMGAVVALSGVAFTLLRLFGPR
jgi:hypothetical protein